MGPCVRLVRGGGGTSGSACSKVTRVVTVTVDARIGHIGSCAVVGTPVGFVRGGSGTAHAHVAGVVSVAVDGRIEAIGGLRLVRSRMLFDVLGWVSELMHCL
jgi:hypothetical protein